MVDSVRDASQNMVTTARQRAAAARRITTELADLGPTLPGTITRRETRCGHTNCRCHADPPQLHGPYWWWTRSVNGKTVTRMLSDDLYDDYRPLFEAQRRARTLLTELEALGLSALQADPRYGKHRTRGPTTPRQPVNNPRSTHP
jgi:hypothetical protein